MITKKLVLALRESERLKGFLKQSEVQDFEVFEAYDGRKEGIPDIIDISAYEEVLGRKPSLPEIGCSVSHYLICKKFAESAGNPEDLLLVAEDDARLAPNFYKIVNRVVKLVNWKRSSLVILSDPSLSAGERNINSTSQRIGTISLLSKVVAIGRYPYILGDVHPTAVGAGTYLINRRATQDYINLVATKNNKISWPADFYLNWAEPAGIRVQVLRPGLASWEGKSTIGGEDHEWHLHNQRLSHYDQAPILNRFHYKLAFRTRIKKIPGILKASQKTLAYLFDDIQSKRKHSRSDTKTQPQTRH